MTTTDERDPAVREAAVVRRTEDEAPHAPDLKGNEVEEVERRTTPRAAVVYEAIRLEGEEELRRSTAGLAWSGVAAGLSMGFSMVAMGLLRGHLPDAPWRPLISSLGYSVGFLIVILGRQQLFTENTLTAILPLLARRNLSTLRQVGRLWGIVLTANLAGAFLFAWLAAGTNVFDDTSRQVFSALGLEALHGDFWNVLLRGVYAGWLIALMVWLMPLAEMARVQVIIILTFLVSLGSFTHIIAGAVEMFFVALNGDAGWGTVLGGYLLPTLLGNILGGVALVAALNFAQVVAGKDQEPQRRL